MRLVVTRPQADGERTAAALRARGHEVLVAPLMRVEPVAADLSGGWGGVIITSANAPGAIAGHPACEALLKLPLFAVGRRSAEAARQAGFTDVTSAGGDVRDLVRLIAERRADATAPLLYLAGEDRAADLVGELAVHGIAAEMAVVYRAVTAPFPPELIAALQGRRGRRRAAFLQAQRRELPRRRGAGRHRRAGAWRAAYLPVGADRRAARWRRRRPHRDRAAAGRGGADRKPGAGRRVDWRRCAICVISCGRVGRFAEEPHGRQAHDAGNAPERTRRASEAAPDGPRRKKRAAPTIDLTATEMPPPDGGGAAAARSAAGRGAAAAAREDRRAANAIGATGCRVGAAALAGGVGRCWLARCWSCYRLCAGRCACAMQRRTTTDRASRRRIRKAIDALTPAREQDRRRRSRNCRPAMPAWPSGSPPPTTP